MKSASSKNGFSLIEVILSIALLGIISMMMIPALTNQYQSIVQTRIMTDDLFAAQQQMEIQISDVKQAIQNNNDLSERTKTSYKFFEGTAFAREVWGYPNVVDVHVGNNAITLKSIIADSKTTSFGVASISALKIGFYNGATALTANYAYQSTTGLQVKTTYTLNDPANVNLTNIYRWYVTRDGFYSPMIANPLEIETGTRFPRFPDDYVLLKSANTKNLPVLNTALAGHHLICTVTPASKSGKIGIAVPSNPLFISGVPFVTGLKLHLDASFLSREDTNIRTSASKYFVTQWKDISGNNNNAAQTTTTRQPELLEAQTGKLTLDGTNYTSYANYVRFNGGQGLTIADNGTLDINNLTVFVALRSASTVSPQTIISKTNSTNGWLFGWTAAGKLGLTIKSGSTNTLSLPASSALNGNWHILTATSALSLQMDQETPLTLTRTASTNLTNNDLIQIGFDGSTNYATVDVAEILVYDAVLTPDQIADIKDYLKNKYQPVSDAVTIVSMQQITDTVIVGEPYHLPSTLTGYMSDGTSQDIAVTWSPAAIDTSTIGRKTSIATSVANPTKTASAQINVAGIVSMENINVTVQVDDPYTLPATAIANLSNGSQRRTAVTWTVSSVDTGTVGTIIVNGTANLDSSKTVTLTINVVPKKVTGISLNASSIMLNNHGASQLTATITPANATNKTVTWSSSDTAIATVSSSGLVTATGSGTATITATTVDGGLTASCTVTVRVPATGVTLDRTTMTLAKNTISPLTATVLPTNASNKNVTWSSSNTSVATVNSGGVVTGVSKGTATITVRTEDGNFTATCVVTVKVSVTSVSLNTTSERVKANRTLQLTATILPSDASDKTVTWSSSDTSVATVSSTGLVTTKNAAVGKTAVITVTTVDGGKTATCLITIKN